MNFFSWDSPLSQSISRAVDYVVINILWLVCCIPIVTIGAATTARFYVAMKIVRREEPSVYKSFFKSFKENFKISTKMWLLEIAVLLFFLLDWSLILQAEPTQLTFIFKILLLIVSILVLSMCFSSFAFIARFEMTFFEYIKASAVFSFIKFPRMVLALVMFVSPVILLYLYMQWLPAVVTVIPALELYFNAAMFVRAFKKLEPEKKEEPEEEEFHLVLDDAENQNDEKEDSKDSIDDETEGNTETEVIADAEEN